MINLTFFTWQEYAHCVIAKSMAGFESPKIGGWPPILSGFFTSVVLRPFLFLGGLLWGGLAPCRPISVSQPQLNTAHPFTIWEAVLKPKTKGATIMIQSNSAIVATQTINSNSTAPNEPAPVISRCEWERRDFLSFAMKLEGHSKKTGFIIEELLKLEKCPNDPVLQGDETYSIWVLIYDFNNELDDFFEEFDLSGSNLLQYIQIQMRHCCESLKFICWNLLSGNEPVDIYKDQLNPIHVLLQDVEDQILASVKVLTEHAKTLSKGDVGIASLRLQHGYDSIMAERIKAIQPKFKALEDICFNPDENDLSTNYSLILQETKKLREEVWSLQEDMPIQSEEGMDCRLAVDQLDFLTRLIESDFSFEKSDLIPVSMIIGQASLAFLQSLSWLMLEGGDVETSRH